MYYVRIAGNIKERLVRTNEFRIYEMLLRNDAECDSDQGRVTVSVQGSVLECVFTCNVLARFRQSVFS